MLKFIAVLCVSVASLGCAGSSQFMIPAAPGTPAPAPTPGAATVVFVRDSGFAFAVNFAILDQSGNFLGESVAKSNFAIRVPAGRFFFVARSSENTDLVQANVEAGRLYFVRVFPRFGVFLARVGLDPIKPSESDWVKLPRWMAKSNQLVPLVGTTRSASAQEPESRSPSIEGAWSSLSASEQAERTIESADGTTSPLASAGPVREDF
jgi:hypothetical protein